jgi:hypothetical protein
MGSPLLVFTSLKPVYCSGVLLKLIGMKIKKILIISEYINEKKKKFQVGSRRKKKNVKVSKGKNLALGVR